MNFKLGDTVRVIARTCQYFDQTGIVADIKEGQSAEFHVAGLASTPFWFEPHELILADPEPSIPAEPDAVNHPQHCGGEHDPYEVIKVAEAWGLDKDAYLFNVLKYIARADKKGATLQDHKKARFYLDRKIKQLEAGQ